MLSLHALQCLFWLYQHYICLHTSSSSQVNLLYFDTKNYPQLTLPSSIIPLLCVTTHRCLCKLPLLLKAGEYLQALQGVPGKKHEKLNPGQYCTDLPTAIWWRQFLNWGSFFPGDSCLCQLDKHYPAQQRDSISAPVRSRMFVHAELISSYLCAPVRQVGV